MEIVLEQYALPEQGKVELDIHCSFELNVTAKQAKRKVNRWLFTEVGCMLSAEIPTLVVGENKVVWRVPAVLFATHVGRVGKVGVVDVDVHTGEMDHRPACVAEIQQRSIELGKHLPPHTPQTDIPAEYLVKHLQPTHQKPTPDPAFIQKVTEALLAEENS